MKMTWLLLSASSVLAPVSASAGTCNTSSRQWCGHLAGCSYCESKHRCQVNVLSCPSSQEVDFLSGLASVQGKVDGGFEFKFEDRKSESVFERYEKQARAVAALATASKVDVVATRAENAKLMAQGEEVMDVYGAKFTECQEQYADFKVKIPTLSKMSVEEIELKYHDGADLKVAPKHCYFGRSLVVHPAMNAVRLSGETITSEQAEAVEEESLEVAAHVCTLEKRLAQ